MNETYITSLQHPLVKHFVKLRQKRRYRYSSRSVLLEGLNAIKDLSHILETKHLLLREGLRIPDGLQAEKVIFMPEELIKKISSVENSEGFIAEFTMPEASSLLDSSSLLVLDGIQDPGNVGTLIRTAMALGWQGVFLLDNSVDPYNDKALRASKGASLLVPLRQGTWDELTPLIEGREGLCFVADAEGLDFQSFQKEKNIILILGNEAKGPSLQALKCGTKVSVKMEGNMESLNVAVAGGILMHGLKA